MEVVTIQYKKIIGVIVIVIMMIYLAVSADAANVDNGSILPVQILQNAEILKLIRMMHMPLRSSLMKVS